MSIEWILLGLFIWLAFTSEAVTGFGSIVIALALGSLVLPIPELLAVLVPLSVLMTGSMLLRFYTDVHLGLLWRMIFPLMLCGMLVGIFLLYIVSAEALKSMFAGLLIWFAGRELVSHFGGITPGYSSVLWQRIWVFNAGVTHGLFASGGPLLVYALSNTTISKAQFRATLVSVWFGLNLIYLLMMILQGRIQPVLPQILSYMPILAFAFWFGQKLHHKVSEQQFRVLIYCLLLLAAIAMLLS